MKRQQLLLVLLLGLLVGIGGCSIRIPMRIQGRVVLPKGISSKDFTLAFSSLGSLQTVGSISIDDDGSYTMHHDFYNRHPDAFYLLYRQRPIIMYSIVTRDDSLYLTNPLTSDTFRYEYYRGIIQKDSLLLTGLTFTPDKDCLLNEGVTEIAISEVTIEGRQRHIHFDHTIPAGSKLRITDRTYFRSIKDSLVSITNVTDHLLIAVPKGWEDITNIHLIPRCSFSKPYLRQDDRYIPEAVWWNEHRGDLR